MWVTYLKQYFEKNQINIAIYVLLHIVYCISLYLCFILCKMNLIACIVIRVRPRFFDQVGHQTTNASIGNKYFFTK